MMIRNGGVLMTTVGCKERGIPVFWLGKPMNEVRLATILANLVKS